MAMSDSQVPEQEASAVLNSSEPALSPLTEVPVCLTVRVGAATLTLGELLALEQGSIVALNKKIGEPVEILVGDRVVATGELVRVEEELGVRILAIAEAGI